MQIRVDNLTLTYQAHTLFEDLSLRADAGQRVCVAGPSGSGKSSLFRALLGFVHPAGGSIHIDGTELNERTAWRLRRHMAYVPQEPELGTAPVSARIMQPFELKANAHLVPDQTQVEAYWQRFALQPRLMDKPATELSGGEKQRVAVIIALLLKRPILLLDEPVSAMDKHSRQVMRELLLEQNDKTILFVSHDESLLDAADAVIDVTARRAGI